MPEGFGDTALAIAAGEDEGDAALDQRFGDRGDRPVVEIDVKDGDVEFRLLGELQGFFDGAGLGGDGMAQIGEHALEQHANHEFILNDEDALAGRGCGVRTHINPVSS